jgi:hypothetical protein
MLIANPIYDVVFKYLMEDNRVAKLLIGKIIGEDILELEPRPQELIFETDTPRSFTVYRLDFSALIKTPKGTKRIIIEIQKAKASADIMRFRRYLGQQYQEKENCVVINGKKMVFPIISIYFLGYSLPDIPAPVLKVRRTYTDLATNKVFPVKNEFIESLTHDSYVIQIERLSGRRRTELEIILSVFDQDNLIEGEHIVNVREESFPEKFRPLIRRLQRAAEKMEIRRIMDAEDDILEELAELERSIETKERDLEAKDRDLEAKDRALLEKDHALEAKNHALEAKNQALAAKNQALEAKDQALEAKDQALEEKKQEIEVKNQEIEEKDKVLEEKDKEIAELLRRLKTLPPNGTPPTTGSGVSETPRAFKTGIPRKSRRV